MNQGAVLDFYATPGRFTTLQDEEFASGDIERVVEVVQGLLVYDAVARPLYGVDLNSNQTEMIHERDTARLLAFARTLDDRPIDQPRPPAKRLGARCHAYSRLTVAFLRAAGVPARARCGFGTYFRPGWFEDHWVAEYWNVTAARWQMVDAQLDSAWCKMLDFDKSPFDISNNDFLTAGSAWLAWRRGELDATRCGLSAVDEHGAHWIAGNLRLDLASLNKVEMLPWDIWGPSWKAGEEPSEDQLRLFDMAAQLTVNSDARLNELITYYETQQALRVNRRVFNVLRGRFESV